MLSNRHFPIRHSPIVEDKENPMLIKRKNDKKYISFLHIRKKSSNFAVAITSVKQALGN